MRPALDTTPSGNPSPSTTGNVRSPLSFITATTSPTAISATTVTTDLVITEATAISSTTAASFTP